MSAAQERQAAINLLQRREATYLAVAAVLDSDDIAEAGDAAFRTHMDRENPLDHLFTDFALVNIEFSRLKVKIPLLRYSVLNVLKSKHEPSMYLNTYLNM